MTCPVAIFAGWLALIRIWNLLAEIQNYVLFVLRAGYAWGPDNLCAGSSKVRFLW